MCDNCQDKATIGPLDAASSQFIHLVLACSQCRPSHHLFSSFSFRRLGGASLFDDSCSPTSLAHSRIISSFAPHPSHLVDPSCTKSTCILHFPPTPSHLLVHYARMAQAQPQLSNKDGALFRQVVRHFENKQYKKGKLISITARLDFSQLTSTPRSKGRRADSPQASQSCRYSSHESPHHQFPRSHRRSLRSRQNRLEQQHEISRLLARLWLAVSSREEF